MKSVLLCLNLAVFVALPAFGTQFGLTESQKEKSPTEWGSVAYNTQLSIIPKSEGNKFNTNQPIELLVRIRNFSTNDEYGMIVQTPITSTEGLSFVITTPSGGDISPVFHRITRVTGLSMDIRPSQEDGFCFELRDVCKIDELGTYQIILKMTRWTPNRQKSYEIVSKPLNIVVTP